MFLSFPFGSSGYELRDISSSDGALDFDCVKCLVAGFFADKNASDLCVQTFCRLDFPLAETWGGELERNGTIASGAERFGLELFKPSGLAILPHWTSTSR